MRKRILKAALVLLSSLYWWGGIGLQSTPVLLAKEAVTAEDPVIGRLYGIGSVSKVFTASAVMKLVEEGLVDLDTPLINYLPEFTMEDSRYVDITPRMLLNHSSGLLGMTDNNAFLLGDNSTYNHDHFLELLASQRLKHDPGELSVYSNDSYTLAEILVEQVSGLTFTEYLQKNFLNPMELKQIQTPQSDFDRALLAPIYLGGRESLPEALGVIGSGGMYASMTDLSRFGSLFTKGSDYPILSPGSLDEMSRIQHIKPLVSEDQDTTFLYGLGWDSVETYPFNTLGIKAIAKGGSTGNYHTNLTVLPEHDLSVAVSSSGSDSYEQLIAQEIILEVLKEEGLLDQNFSLSLPEYNTTAAPIPDVIKAYAGLYDAGRMGGMFTIEFTEDTLVMTTVNARVEKTQTYVYNQDEEFVSANGDYITFGFTANQGGTRGITRLSFLTDEKGQAFLMGNTYENQNGLSQTASALPLAQKIEPASANTAANNAWMDRNNKKYFLVSETYSSFKYTNQAILRPMLDERAAGYVSIEVYQTKGALGTSARIYDANSAKGFQQTPTMPGRDIVDMNIAMQDGYEVLHVNNYRYLEEDAIQNFNATETNIRTTSDAVWFHIDSAYGGSRLKMDIPQRGSIFLFDENLNYISTSRLKDFDNTITLPKNGYILFAGENQTFTFTVTDNR